MASLNINQANFDFEQQSSTTTTLEVETKDFDFLKRSQWLRAAVLGANDGLVSTASLVMGVGAVKQDIKAMILTGFASACSKAIGEFISVNLQLDIKVAQMKGERERGREVDVSDEKKGLPNPLQAAAASALGFVIGAMVPLLAAFFISYYKMRLGVVVGAVSFALVVFGWFGAVLGKVPFFRSILRVLIGGWVAMSITFGITKLTGSNGI